MCTSAQMTAIVEREPTSWIFLKDCCTFSCDSRSLLTFSRRSIRSAANSGGLRLGTDSWRRRCVRGTKGTPPWRIPPPPPPALLGKLPPVAALRASSRFCRAFSRILWYCLLRYFGLMLRPNPTDIPSLQGGSPLVLSIRSTSNLGTISMYRNTYQVHQCNEPNQAYPAKVNKNKFQQLLPLYRSLSLSHKHIQI